MGALVSLVRAVGYAPLDVLRRATIPSAEAGRWNRFYAMTNVMLGRGSHSFSFRLNVSAFSRIGCPFRGCLGGV